MLLEAVNILSEVHFNKVIQISCKMSQTFRDIHTEFLC